jgi:PleD family two-component response regulator
MIQQEKRPEEAPAQIKTQTQSKTQTPKDTSTSTTPAAPQTTTKNPTLLLVDDNKVNLQLLTMYAKKRKYPYLEAIDGQLAVNAYQKAHEDSSSATVTTSGAQNPPPSIPAIILMDINMPVVSFFAFNFSTSLCFDHHGIIT